MVADRISKELKKAVLVFWVLSWCGDVIADCDVAANEIPNPLLSRRVS